MKSPLIRPAQPADCGQLATLRHCLWPDASIEEHARELALFFAGEAPGKLPATILVADAGGGAITGFLEADLRSHADGCDPAVPTGYVEGWYVVEDRRRQGIGARLLAAAEDWARRHGCREMASDTWIDNDTSQRAHEALGFEVVDRCVHYRKSL